MSALADARWHWTADAYETAAASGVFGPDPKVELLDGEVILVAPMLPGHAHAVAVLNVLVARQLDPTVWTVGCQTPVRLADDSEPEPDLWVAHGGLGTYGRRHPGPEDLTLVIEVSDTSLRLDRSVKVPAYRSARVPEIWLFSVPERNLTIHRGEDAETLAPGAVARHTETGLTVPVAQVFAHLDG